MGHLTPQKPLKNPIFDPSWCLQGTGFLVKGGPISTKKDQRLAHLSTENQHFLGGEAEDAEQKGDVSGVPGRPPRGRVGRSRSTPLGDVSGVPGRPP